MSWFYLLFLAYGQLSELCNLTVQLCVNCCCLYDCWLLEQNEMNAWNPQVQVISTTCPSLQSCATRLSDPTRRWAVPFLVLPTHSSRLAYVPTTGTCQTVQKTPELFDAIHAKLFHSIKTWILGTLYLHTFVLSTPYPPLNATEIPSLPVCYCRLVIMCERLRFVLTIFGAI